MILPLIEFPTMFIFAIWFYLQTIYIKGREEKREIEKSIMRYKRRTQMSLIFESWEFMHPNDKEDLQPKYYQECPTERWDVHIECPSSGSLFYTSMRVFTARTIILLCMICFDENTSSTLQKLHLRNFFYLAGVFRKMHKLVFVLNIVWNIIH